ncbi:MAG: hypothetical protein IJ509_00345 [Bacilli bacterium]|nr:hypothetical protein [Bacilli bacterium]
MKKEIRLLYGVLAVFVLSICTIGATYAYWTASTRSAANSVKTKSTIYSISMQINPLYNDFSVIPMNDNDALKALNNKCKDKYKRGACSAYTIYVYDYNEDLDFISGIMDIQTNNMQNISYMMLRISDTYEEDKCVKINNVEEKEEIYCVAKEAAPMGDGVGLSLGDSYDVTGMSSTKFILLIWLSNLQQSQNDTDIGSFEAIITMQAGNGGQIKGSIASSIKIENTVGDEA